MAVEGNNGSSKIGRAATSKRFNHAAIHFNRHALLKELDTQDEFKSVLILNDLATQAGQWPADDLCKRPRLKAFLARHGQPRAQQKMNVAKLAFDLRLVVDSE